MKNLITCLTVCVLSGAAFATTWTVDDDGLDFPADFDNIQDAVDASSDGDVIVVYPGTYTNPGQESFLVLPHDLSFQSSDPSNPDVVASTIILGEHGLAQDGFVYTSNQSAGVDGLTFQGFSKAININDGGIGAINLTNCLFKSNLYSIYGDNVYSLTVDLCTFENDADELHSFMCDNCWFSVYNVYLRGWSLADISNCEFSAVNPSNPQDLNQSFELQHISAGDTATTQVTNCNFTGQPAMVGTDGNGQPYYWSMSPSGFLSGGSASSTLDKCTFTELQWGVRIGDVTASIYECVFENCLYGISTTSESYVIQGTIIKHCQTGIEISSSASLSLIENSIISENNIGISCSFWGSNNQTVEIQNSQITMNYYFGIHTFGNNSNDIRLLDSQLCSNGIANYYCDELYGYGCPTFIDLGGNNMQVNCNGTGTINVPDDYDTIEEAVLNAYDGDEIVVAPGTYLVESTLYFSTGITIRSTDGPENTIFDGQGLTQIFTAGNWHEISNLTIEGITFKNGSNTDSGWYPAGGGAGFILNTNITLTNCIFENNYSESPGGALFFYVDNFSSNFDVNILIDNCVFLDNSSSGYHYWSGSFGGGAICFEVSAWYGKVTYSISIINSTFDFNSTLSDDAIGGAIYYNQNSSNSSGFTDFQITGSSFNNNTSSKGGAIAQQTTTLTSISSTSFEMNVASDRGGALYTKCSTASTDIDPDGCGFDLYKCTLNNNSSSTAGGAVALESGGPMGEYFSVALLNDCTVESNSSQSGGGIYLGSYGTEARCSGTTFRYNEAVEGGSIFLNIADDYYPDNALLVIDCDFEENNAIFGGAIYGGNWTYAPAISECTFTDNTGIFGAGIYNDSSELEMTGNQFYTNDGEYGGAIYNRLGILNMENTVISGNTGWQGGGIFSTEALTTITNSWISGNTAEEQGGGIYNLISYTEISDTTLCGNGPDNIFGAWSDEGNVIINDECLDCDGDGSPDWYEIYQDSSLDCNLNSILDWCEIKDGSVADCDGNGTPDSCDLVADPSLDCDANGVMDYCETNDGSADDCNANGLPDSCDIANGTSLDIDANDIPDECEDCNGNEVPDGMDLANCDGSPWCSDCNTNSELDVCDIASGESNDLNENGIPDECECLEDVNGDFFVGVEDILFVIADWGNVGGATDINQDGIVDVLDLLAIVAAWGPCE